MPVNRRKLGALLGALLATAVVAGTAAASHRSTPGVSSKKIVIGGTFPLSEGPETGGASLYKTIPFAEKAYYAYVNAHGGVHHRKIDDIVLDDQYTPSETVQQTTKLVEQDHIFADVGSLGTAPGLSTWGYLNKHKVPQVLLATGDAYWGNCVHHACQGSTKPWTLGWQPDYPGEAKLYAKYILKHKSNAKIGVLYQNDAYGKNYLAGLKTGLGSHKGQIVDAEAYNAGDASPVVGAHVFALKTHGADTFVIFATPGASIAALATLPAIGWSPLTLLNNVSSNRIFMQIAAQNHAKLNGVISTAYVESQTAQPNLPGMKLAKKIIHNYAPQLDQQFAAGDGNLVYGLAVGWTFVDALKHSGKNPTRKSLMHALRTMDETNNPFIYPGMVVKTSKKRTFPMEQLIFEKWGGGDAGDWKTFGKVLNSGH
ncbi:MAG TPA: ABC transporter substrate-binding protein [Gaiellaceae bacterium]|jgi:branched-chain amino acid transport system substrate-binding protein|nr:ABC transporter substrate-binding protein [Gaiellaceae bacterium]